MSQSCRIKIFDLIFTKHGPFLISEVTLLCHLSVFILEIVYIVTLSWLFFKGDVLGGRKGVQYWTSHRYAVD